eukprot:Gb_11102 [translate_table: standard]
MSWPQRVRNNINIATKFAAYPWRLTSEQFVQACKNSLGRLQLEQLGIGQLHWSTANYAPLQEKALWNGLIAMHEKDSAACKLFNLSAIMIDVLIWPQNQVQFSLLSMDKEKKELKILCDALGIQLISYSPLGLGMLTGKYSASRLPQGPRKNKTNRWLMLQPPTLQSNIARFRTFAKVAKRNCK